MGTVQLGADKEAAKASVLRGYVAALKKEGLFDEVYKRVSPECRRVMEDPPPASVWMPTDLQHEIGRAVVAIAGLGAWKRLTRDAVTNGLMPVIRTVIEGFLRLFGATPSTLYSRIGAVTASTSRGIAWGYDPISETSGMVRITYPGRRDVTLDVFVGAAGGLESVFDLLGVDGTTAEPEILDTPARNSARIRVSWSLRKKA